MSTVDRCTCIPHYQYAGAGLTEYVPEADPSCPQHGGVEHILHSGEYIDRLGMRWTRTHYNNWTAPRPPRVSALADEAQMRLLIERDQHRDECPGLHWCDAHPVPRVHFNIHTRAPIVVSGDEYIFPDGGFSSHAAAMDAARALAVEP